MGCDIHLYIEHKNKNEIYWSNFGGEINPGRNYGIFLKLCGVRNQGEINSMLKPKGLPEDISWKVRDDNTLFIDDEGAKYEGYCSKDIADKWVNNGYSQIVSERRVTHPDWHSHSWATSKELKNALETQEQQEYVDSEWKMVLFILEKFEMFGEESRIVFWFDN